MTDLSKLRAIEPYGERWNKLAGQLAQRYIPKIYPCKHCKYPVVEGYVCEWCNASDPR